MGDSLFGARVQMRSILHQKLKNELKRRADKCHYCAILFKTSKEKSIDHIIPLIHGGKDTVDNLTIACMWCNKMKSNASSDDFLCFLEYMKVAYVGFPDFKPPADKRRDFVRPYNRLYATRLYPPIGSELESIKHQEKEIKKIARNEKKLQTSEVLIGRRKQMKLALAAVKIKNEQRILARKSKVSIPYLLTFFRYAWIACKKMIHM